MIYCIIGIFLGAKILYLITVLPQFIADLPYLFEQPIEFLATYLASGFVFYGGFYGGIVTTVIYCRVNHLSFWDMMRSFVPLVPLFHMFGRIGCFLTGCCYGIENDVIGIVFTSSEIAPNGVPLIPVQLFEAAGEAVLFIVTAYMTSKPNSGAKALSTWLIGYGVLRFALEFLRGDAYRGFAGPFSTSQIIALISIAWGIFIIVRMVRSRSSQKQVAPS